MKPPIRVTTVAQYAVPIVVAAALFATADLFRLAITNQLTSLLLLACLAMAWNLVSGFGGQFSLGHSIFVGVGGYTAAVVLDYAGWPLIPVLLGAGLASAAIGVVLAYPMLRLRGPYFAIGTLGIALAALGWMLNWDFTRASRGYPIPPSAMLDLTTLLRVAIVLAVVTFLVVLVVKNSPLGLRLLALRDNEDGAVSLGVRRLSTLVPVWAISAFLAGSMGAVVALQNGNLTPNSAFSVQYTLDAVVVCVIGGMGTLSGPILGAVVVFLLRQYTADFAGWATLIEAAVVILIVRFFPDGAVGLIVRAGRRIRVLRAAGRKSATPPVERQIAP
ncbi:MAG: branched-chain amino acid ABC transporter permease [Pseudolysinimonas sp.]|uniref:branched-chain amino acid ABC transporter permease n=1 Tax=Pseudolysinimonas sp. TaxID=2680009 RepID=UPI003C761E63